MEETKLNRASRITRLFPPPKFLTMPAVGLDISDRSMKFIELTSGTRRRVGVFGNVPLSEGMIVQGEIKDSARLGKELSAVAGRLPSPFVRVSLPEEKAYLFQMEVPHPSRRTDVRSVIEFKLEEYVPLPPQDVVFDFDIAALHEGSDSHADVVVAAYPRVVAEEYAQILGLAGLFPLAFEVEAEAVVRAVVPKGDRGTYMVVDFGERRTGLSIVSAGALAFTTTLEVKGSVLTEAVMKHLHASPEEADRFKTDEGIAASADKSALVSVLLGVVSALKEEMSRHYAYWSSGRGKEAQRRPPIEKIILCGGNANLAGLPEYLSQSLKVPTARANVWVNAFSLDEETPPIDKRHSLSYATSIGLALASLP